MLLHTCSSLTMISTVIFVIVPFWPELVNSLPNVLHFALIAGQKVDQTSLITIKSLIYYVSLSFDSTGKSWCLITLSAPESTLCSPLLILNMWPVTFFWSVESMFVGDRQWLSLIMELSIHCYNALVLQIVCNFGYLIAT